jgi:phosphatidylglycerophosphatase A
MQNKFWPEGVATLFGVGKWGKAPGTMGSFVALPVIFGMSFLNPFFYMAVCVLLIVIAIVAADQYGKGENSKEIVADEFVGLMVTLYLVPRDWTLWILGFLLFRFFAVLKPFPLSHLDKNVKGGFGVVLDDLVAGLFANGLIHFGWIPYIAPKIAQKLDFL